MLQLELQESSSFELIPCNEREAAAAAIRVLLPRRLESAQAAADCSPEEAQAILARYVANGMRF